MNTGTVTGRYENLDSSRFQQKLATTAGAILIDVRTEAEFEKERIPNSININVMDPSFMMEISSLDKNKIYFLYCRSGGRSGSACSIMSEQGYQVYNLAGGISNWTGEISN